MKRITECYKIDKDDDPFFLLSGVSGLLLLEEFKSLIIPLKLNGYVKI